MTQFYIYGLDVKQGLLWLQKCWCLKNRQFQKVGARKFRCHNLFVQNRSLSSMILLFYYWLHVKRVNCYVYYDLFCYTGRFVYFGAIFMLKMKQKLRLRTTTRSLPTACKQRMIPNICYGL